MRRMQAFKCELQADREQERDMRRFVVACRFVFNKALAIQTENYEAGSKFIGYVAINILERGHRLLACGKMVHVGRSKKQEPTEVESVSF